MDQRRADRDVTETPGALPVGSKLGKYEIVEQLGVGGQSIVYKGFDPLLERHVAIKQVAPHVAADEKFSGRFREVARHLARMNAEEVVTILELMEDARGLFIVMEFVEGHSIENSLAGSPDPVDPKAVLQIVWRIAAGLAAIHKAGIIHRDIKPGNVIVGEGLRVKITDFGVAARAGAPASMRLGTTKYMAPELFGGEHRVDERADIYSLGMIAYEMLAGRAKFNEVFHDIVRDPHSEAIRWMKWHSSPEPAPPLAEVNPAVPPAMAAIVTRMIAKDPDARYPNVEALGRDIRGNFSPRSQRPAAKAGRRRRVSVDAAADAESRAAAAGVLAAPPPDLSDAPAETGEPKTAEIPREPMSTGKKLAILGTIAAIALVVLVGWWIKRESEQNAIDRAATGEFSVALATYKRAAEADTPKRKRKLFEEAQAAFAAVEAKYQGRSAAIHAKAKVRAYMAKAYALVLAKDWEGAEKEHKQADTTTRKIERNAPNASALYYWTQDILIELNDFLQFLARQKAFTTHLAEATKAKEEGDLKRARSILEKDAKREAKSDLERAAVAAMLQLIRVMEQQEAYTALMTAANELAKKGDVKKAIEIYEEAVKVLDEVRSTLSEKDYNDLKAEAESKRTFLVVRTDCAKAIAEARKTGKGRKKRLEAAAAYRKAAKMLQDAAKKLTKDQYGELIAKDTPQALTDKANQLEHDFWLQKGYEARDAGQTKTAEKHFHKAGGFIKNSPAVVNALAELEKRKHYFAKFQEAEKLFKAKSWEAAAEAFKQAMKFPGANTKHIRTRLSDCSYFVNLTKARAARGLKKWNEARRYFLQAKRDKPSMSQTIDTLLEQLARERAFVELMAAAERAILKKSWMEAVDKLNDAKRLKPRSTEVELKLKGVRYSQAVEMGDTAMADNNFAAALASYKLAKRYKATPEIDVLIQKAEQALKAAGGGS